MNWEGYTDQTLALPGTVIPGRHGYRRMTPEEYHAFPAVNASLLKCRTPAEMHAQLTSPPKETDALTIGTLVHLVTLEPQSVWAERFALADIPINKTTGAPYGQDSKKAQEAWEKARKENPGKIIVTDETLKEYLNECLSLRDCITANPDAMQELEGADFEVTGIIWHPTWQCWVKWRMDILPRRMKHIADVKTSSRHPADFIKDCWQFGYFTQAAWYAHLHELLMSRSGMNVTVSKFTFIIQSKEDTKKFPRPPMCRVADLPMAPGLSTGVDRARMTLGIPQGLSRVDVFLDCVRNYIEAGKPGDFHTVRNCWPAYEMEAGEKGGRFVITD